MAIGLGGFPKQVEEEQKEDASELKFPKEFNKSEKDALMTSEVLLLLEHRQQQSELKEDIEDVKEVFIKTLDYCRRMAKFRNRETIRSVRQTFGNLPQIHKFEEAQLASLVPEGSEEAKALIPSLENKLTDEQLDEVLKELAQRRTFE
ncbi:hypothetical protein L596_017524 [Steinernema carpocapsae]|uniref:RNA polymerase Rpb4/RPC9 core domain-containing protein n=1 Tax=Steinernema carpocapsae TaxID=34508 RepID=A0A4U5N265_STECR|nr:hypothetical protein L596_017524 [Steinernema carpocapsae]